MLQSICLVLVVFVAAVAAVTRSETATRLSRSLQMTWNVGGIDYAWDDGHEKLSYIESGKFIVDKNTITGIKVFGDRIFVTVPRWFAGIPSTLNMVQMPRRSGDDALINPTLVPYPSWEANRLGGDCVGLQYLQSMEIDKKGIMWALDVGRVNIFGPPELVDNRCPPKLITIDVATGKFVDEAYIFPDEVASHTTSFLNDLVVDNDRQIAYISDTSGEGGIVVYDRLNRRSRRFTAPEMKPDMSGDIDWKIGNVFYPNGSQAFQATPQDGIALSPDGETLYVSFMFRV